MESKTNVISLWRNCRLEPLLDNYFSAIGDEPFLRVLLPNLASHQTEVFSIYKLEKAWQR